MDVTDWQDSPRPVIAKKRAPHRFLPPTMIGVLGTLLLHALVLQSVPFGYRGSKPPDAQESADTRSKSLADGAESLVLITLPTMGSATQITSQNPSSLPTLSKLKIKSPVNVDPPTLSVDTLALSEDQVAKSTSDSDGAELGRLFGIYTGQIQARINRVWRRPRTPVIQADTSVPTIDSHVSFQCEVQIVQDAKGYVQEILLPHCNGSPEWQRSLVIAIQQASPLPAPPSVKVFTQSITLNFVGLPYVTGSAEDDYEVEPRKVANSNNDLIF
jgi:hypothetical protein